MARVGTHVLRQIHPIHTVTTLNPDARCCACNAGKINELLICFLGLGFYRSAELMNSTLNLFSQSIMLQKKKLLTLKDSLPQFLQIACLVYLRTDQKLFVIRNIVELCDHYYCMKTQSKQESQQKQFKMKYQVVSRWGRASRFVQC